ncbi:MAG: L-threonylcarbamoyladenylate synthase [Pseudomonadota bacterium]|nr:L-threonylcarbamoyladenylate synthase [Pseudomonadota bacterium]
MIIPATPDNIAVVAERLRTGQLVAFPTETVYGLGGDATDSEAVARIFAAKNRPNFNPLIVHVPDLEIAAQLGNFTKIARKIAEAFWPGPLSIVVKRQGGCSVSLLASAGLDTLALRVPAHDTAQAILRDTGRPIAAPSANASGKISPTTATHVQDSIGDVVELIVDAGACSVGLESTVIDCTSEIPIILRPGGITAEQIENLVGRVKTDEMDSNKPRSPGMLKSHYAPDAELRLNATSVDCDEALLAFGQQDISGAVIGKNLSAAGNLEEAAANLFSMLRELDGQAERIAVRPIPELGLGRAINDRLKRAAA